MPGAVFLDRDGVLCDNRSTYVKTWDEFHWIPGAREALRVLGGLDLAVVMITNQSAINRGLTTLGNVQDVHARMQLAIRHAEGRLDAVYLCPHRPDEGCACRKPALLLFRNATTELGLDLARSYLIGDNLSDLQAGWDLGVRVILVRTGLGEQTAARLDGAGRRVRVVRDVLEAASWIETMCTRDVGRERASGAAIAGSLALDVRREEPTGGIPMHSPVTIVGHHDGK